MQTVTSEPEIIRNAPIPTWFGIGGGADRFCKPRTPEELEACLAMDRDLRVLGDGANLLVDDDGVGELVVHLGEPAFRRVWKDPATGHTCAMAGADLAKLVTSSVREGLQGLEGLGGIPATLGGALVMNAGGAFGQIADTVVRVHALTRDAKRITLERADIDFSYRHSGLNGYIILSAELALTPGDPVALREKLKDVMEYKKKSQPMADKSAGCCFKNPTLPHDLPHDLADIGARGSRVGAGLLIDRAGLKGTRVGGAAISQRHANFFVTDASAKARDVIDLMHLAQTRVFETFGVRIDPEVVIWRRAIEGGRS